jgi:hypothetical protein
VKDLSSRERSQIFLLLFDAPDSVDHGMHALINDYGQDGHDGRSVFRDGATDEAAWTPLSSYLQL